MRVNEPVSGVVSGALEVAVAPGAWVTAAVRGVLLAAGLKYGRVTGGVYDALVEGVVPGATVVVVVRRSPAAAASFFRRRSTIFTRSVVINASMTRNRS
jgi:hypothetical protein